MLWYKILYVFLETTFFLKNAENLPLQRTTFQPCAYYSDIFFFCEKEGCFFRACPNMPVGFNLLFIVLFDVIQSI